MDINLYQTTTNFDCVNECDEDMPSEPSEASYKSALTKKFSDLTTFGDRTELLLGIPLVKVLQNGGSLFITSRPSTAAYRHAVKVSKLDSFVSHNWVVSRIPKYLALIFYFNSLLAFAVSCSVMALFLVWQSFGPHPVVFLSVIFDREVGFLCRLLFVPIFLATNLSIRPILAALGCQGPMLFVDKACIRQDDPTEMSLGINKLAAFLHFSSEMIVLYSDFYLTRLWTVYEVASFVALHPMERLRIVPVIVPIAFYSCLILSWLGNVWSIYVHARGLPRISIDIVKSIACGVYAYILRKWVRDKQQIKERLSTFEVRGVVCECNDDKPLIFARIDTLMQCVGACPRGCSIDESLDAFNAKVRTDLPQAFQVLLGTISFDYMSLVSLSVCMMGLGGLDSVFVTLIEGTLRSNLTKAAHGLVWTFIYFPLLLASAEILLSYHLNLTGIKDFGWVTIVVLLLASIAVSINYGITLVTERADTSDVFFDIVVGASTLQCCIAGVGWFYFVRKRHIRLNFCAFRNEQVDELQSTQEEQAEEEIEDHMIIL